eukprot:CAMPEP_0198139592 /NCGR_PEP_ID=MMETSP1443-20131203/2879_1 /TAXON_ID=186043 /ORGANISM="Entomoneis sp., Strain CCMP2396" /LENGTH=211 /DNA_ID=CAMNT_0043801765 /DNA_START=82 /DNA_END=718 /DNA_ORIENTATION=-
MMKQKLRASLSPIPRGKVTPRSHHKEFWVVEQTQLEKSHEDERFRSNDQKDVNHYRDEIKQKQQDSLVLRGKESVRIRRQEKEEKNKQLEKSHKDELLRSNDQKDVDKYLQEMEQKRKELLVFRGKESVRIRRLQEAERIQQLKKAGEDAFLRAQDAKDANLSAADAPNATEKHFEHKKMRKSNSDDEVEVELEGFMNGKCRSQGLEKVAE